MSEKKTLNETKNHNSPPPFKLNGRSLTKSNRKIYHLDTKTATLSIWILVPGWEQCQNLIEKMTIWILKQLHCRSGYWFPGWNSYKI